jgi:hypothetical protein
MELECQVHLNQQQLGQGPANVSQLPGGRKLQLSYKISKIRRIWECEKYVLNGSIK